MRLSAASLAISLVACAIGWNAAATTAARPVKADKEAIAASIASPERLQSDRDQDSWRKPDVILTLLGARPGMHAIDYLAADGYYSELLARIVGPKGRVIVYNNGGYSSFIGPELVKRFANKRVPNTDLKVTEIADLKLPPRSLDAALFVMSYHDVYFTPRNAKTPMGEASQMVSALFDALKPGGVVVVEDHVAQAGGNPAETVQKLHRIDPDVVKHVFEQAGFKFDIEESRSGTRTTITRNWCSTLASGTRLISSFTGFASRDEPKLGPNAV
jgi:predicted methyltransferase